MKKLSGFILIFVISLLAIKPLFIPGFFPMHDDTQVARVFEMGKMLKMGVFPVRWVPDLGYGYGYPIFNFYAPLAYYAGGLLATLGLDALVATKVMIGLAIIASGFSMYLLAAEFFGAEGGLVSGLFYVFAPYHALDLYVRGDIAELYAYVFLPLTFYGIWKIGQSKRRMFIIVTAMSIAGLVLSHNLTAFMAMPFIIGFGLFSMFHSEDKTKTAFYLVLAGVAGLLLSTFYWLPALSEMGKTNVLSQIGGGADFKDHFVCLPQLWDSPWGFGGSAKGCIDGLSFRIGKIHIIFGLLSLALLVWRWREWKKTRSILLFFACGALLSVFMVLEIAKPIWDAIPQMAFLQYPWRYLLLVSFFISFLSGTLVLLSRNMQQRIVVLGISIALVLIFNLKLFTPQTILGKTASDYTSDYALKWVASKISDEYLPKGFRKPTTASQVAVSPTSFIQTPIEQIANDISVAGVILSFAGIIYATRRKA